MSISEYNDGLDVISKDHGGTDFVRISPSSIANFFASTRQWYGETLLNEPGFEGSDATVLGSIVHYFTEQATWKKQPITSDESNKLVQDYLNKQKIPINRSEIEPYWKEMSSLLIKECTSKKKFHSTETYLFKKLLPGIYVGGTYDGLVELGNGTYSVLDYKTASTKPSGISYHYRMQAHVYAWLLINHGFKISQIELQYVVKPTKTLPCRYFQFVEPFTDEDYQKIDAQLKLIADSVNIWIQQPELRYLLAQDYRLKLPVKPKLFKD